MVEDIRRHLEAALEVTGTMRWSEQTQMGVISKLQTNFEDEDIEEGLDEIIQTHKRRISFAEIEEVISRIAKRKNIKRQKERPVTAEEKEFAGLILSYCSECIGKDCTIDEFFEGLETTRKMLQSKRLFDVLDKDSRWARWVREKGNENNENNS